VSCEHLVIPPEDGARGVPARKFKTRLPFKVSQRVLDHGVTIEPVEAPKPPPVVVVTEEPEEPFWKAWGQRAEIDRDHKRPGGAAFLHAPEPTPEVIPELPPPLAIVRQVLECEDDLRRNLRFAGKHGARLQQELATLPPAGDQEGEFGFRAAAVEIAIARARIGGVPNEWIAEVTGSPVPSGLRLWAPACSECDAIEEAEKESARQKERAQEQHRRNAAHQAARTIKTCKERGVVEYHVSPGMNPAAWFSEVRQGFDFRLEDGTGVACFARTPGIVWPAETTPGSRIYQEDDVSPLTNAIADRPAPARLSNEEFAKVVLIRVPLDQSQRPEWSSCSRATRGMLLDRLEERGRAVFLQGHMGYERQLLAEQFVRGGLERPDVAAGLIWKWMQKVNEPQAARNRAFLGQDLPAGAITRDELEALCRMVASAGRVKWGSLNVPLAEAAGQAWESIVAPLRRLFSSKPEVTSAEALEVTGLPDVPQSHVQIVAAAESLGVKKSRLSGPEGRYYAFVAGAKGIPEIAGTPDHARK
jgi:hypothetical protein